MNVTWLGTGLMGRPMAERLLAAGHRLTVWNRTLAKTAPLVVEGATAAESPRDAVAAGRTIVLMLRDAAVSRRLLGLDLDAPDLRAPDLGGRTVVQMSTVGPAESCALRDGVVRAGGEYVEAPVLGSRPQAADGTLLVMVGSTDEQYVRLAPLLENFGPLRRVGEVGQASALKLALNQVIATQMTAFATSLGLVRRHGIPVDDFMDILRDSKLYAPTFDAKLPRMLTRDFGDPNFPLELLLKDVLLVLADAREQGVATEPLDGVRAVLERALAAGLGGNDYSALYSGVDPPEQ